MTRKQASEKKNLEKTARTSESVENKNLEKLREVFPQFVTESKKDGKTQESIDFDALREFFESEGLLGEGKYGLNWAGKTDAFRALRTPATGTLTPQEDESKDWENTQNLFLEGDNLEVLKLLQKHYREQVKMIYIDPPYNTGGDFIYKDNFHEGKADYYERTGQSKDGVKMTSNPESNGRYHSDWLTMMYPRLFLAKNLLKEDGVIFISIDDNEVHNLRHICDEIFGEENFVGSFIWKKKGTSTNVAGAQLSSLTEYILLYRKSEKGRIHPRLFPSKNRSYPNRDEMGAYRVSVIEKRSTGAYDRPSMKFKILGQEPRKGKRWQVGKEKAKELELNNRFVIENGIVKVKIYDFEDLDTESAQPNLLLEQGSTQEGQATVDDLIENTFFDNPKPVSLILHLLEIAIDDDSLILDFFAGSGTLAHAVMEKNAQDRGERKYICVQIPEEADEKTEAYKAGYKNIAEISRERIRRAGKQIQYKIKDRAMMESKDSNDYFGGLEVEPDPEYFFEIDSGFKAFSLTPSNYREWSILTDENNEEDVLEQSKIFLENPLIDGYDEKSVVYEILLKEGFDLNAEVKKEKSNDLEIWRVKSDEKKMLVTFTKSLTKDAVESLNLEPDTLFVCFDSALDDATKVNLVRNFNVKVI